MKISDEGICRFCLKTFAGRSIGKHLTACKVKKEQDSNEVQGKKATPIYHLKISSYKPFWLHIEVKATSKLKELDQFLRQIWLECCGHLSQFIIHNKMFDDDENSMNVPLNKILSLKDTFEHEYDFGSTTYLKGQVVAQREGFLKKKISILARNNLPLYPCVSCANLATRIDLEEGEFYCDSCFEEHSLDEDMWLPVVNSPRMGVCGYDGLQDTDNFKI